MPDVHLSTGAYALDALDDVERRAFERHLGGCEDCLAEITDFSETTAMLADRVATTPPAALRAAVLGEITRTRQVAPGRKRLPRFSWRSVVTSAAAVLIAAGAATGGVAYQGHRAAEAAQVEAAGIARVYADPVGRSDRKVTSAGGNTAVVVAAGSAVFSADGLPAVPAGKTYQLWIIRGEGQTQNIRSAGLFTPTDGSGQTLIKNVPADSTVAMTVEPDGGSRQPSTQPIVALTAV